MASHIAVANGVRKKVWRKLADRHGDSTYDAHCECGDVSVPEVEEMIGSLGGATVKVKDHRTRHRTPLKAGCVSRRRVWVLRDQRAWEDFLSLEDLIRSQAFYNRAAGATVLTRGADLVISCIPVVMTLSENVVSRNFYTTRLEVRCVWVFPPFACIPCCTGCAISDRGTEVTV